MSRSSLAAACVAAAFVSSGGVPAWAGDCDALSARCPAGAQAEVAALSIVDGFVTAGPWTLAPVAELHRQQGGPFGAPADPDTVTASLGFRGAARIDSRMGAIYSRLSLSFEHEFRANGQEVVSGWSGRRRNGFYGDRSEVDVMTADAAFAVRMSRSTVGFLEYGAEMEPGGAPDHQVILRLRFDF